MDIHVDAAQVATLLMASVRVLAFLCIAPPFAGPAVPVKVKVGMSVALALVVTPRLTGQMGDIDLAHLVVGVVFQAGIGLALGFLVSMLFSAVQAAGQLVDVSVGFSSAAIYDPFAQAGLSPMARLYQILATLLLFSTGGYLLIIGGLLRSFDATAQDVSIRRIDAVLVDGLGTFFVAALQIGLPLLAALFMAELLLGLLTKAAPQLNLLVVGFGAKSLILLVLGASALVLLPRGVEMIVDQAMRGMAAIAG
ncbi:flagellar biosynthetic protein FliR [Dermatobacter hominis]|uniref:flagellar biosynthetic protein FliR n=1 Tax=Dermatobacter hominis TaxID=2884263 RepID=UPI001D10051F|nr:flagellar biosynthetic protein FliR [Dermatobacter hominis]UDY37195.1 flagellar biosynthetic protein FliR [Dermatobacter hominis]